VKSKVKSKANSMAIESISREFEVFMREMIKVKECAHENIESELRRLIRTTVNSCATLYGFSANEALAKLDSNGNILPQITEIPNQGAQKRSKEAEKAEKLRVKEFQKAQKAEIKEFEKTEAIRRKEFEKAKKTKLKEAEKAEKANELSERNKMKEQDIASKAINQKEKKKTLTKRERDEETYILFQKLPLIQELNSIRNIKVQKKLSTGVKLARQILDI
jgi:hypothetical protein